MNTIKTLFSGDCFIVCKGCSLIDKAFFIILFLFYFILFFILVVRICFIQQICFCRIIAALSFAN